MDEVGTFGIKTPAFHSVPYSVQWSFSHAVNGPFFVSFAPPTATAFRCRLFQRCGPYYLSFPAVALAQPHRSNTNILCSSQHDELVEPFPSKIDQLIHSINNIINGMPMQSISALGLASPVMDAVTWGPIENAEKA